MITRARSLLCFAFLALLLPAPAQAGQVKAFDAPMSGAQIFDYDTESKQVTSTIPKLLGVDPSNVVGEWYAGWSSAGDLLDLSGHGRDLADTHAPTITQSSLVGPDGNQLQAFSFDGANDFFSLADASWMSMFDSDFTISAVCKINAASAGNDYLFTHFAVRGIIFYSANGVPYTTLYGASGSTGPTKAGDLRDGSYHVWSVVRSGGFARLFIDGVPGDSVDVSAIGSTNITASLNIGGTSYWNGDIAYTRLQNSALTYAQVQKEVSLWQGTGAGIGGNRLGTPTFIRSTTSYAERSTGSTSLVQVPANWPAKTSDGGVLVEGAVTQLATYTGAFSTGWTKTNSSIAATSVTLPDGSTGTTNTLREVYVTPENGHLLGTSYSATSGTSYCGSFYAKYNSAAATPREWVRLLVSDGVNYKSYYFNVRYGYSGTAAGALTGGNGVKPVGNGWYRVWVWATAGATNTGSFTLYVGEADNDATFEGVNPSQDSVFIYGPQLQSGAFPTTYHPNPTTGASRSADSLTYIPWRISKDLASKVNATPKLLFLGSESLIGATVAPTTGSYTFTKNGRPQNDDTYAEGPSHKFNGTTDWLSLPDASGGSDFDFSAAGKKFSVTFTYTPLSVTGSGGIINKWNDSGVDKRGWMIYQSTSTLNFFVSKNGLSGAGNWTSTAVTSALEIGKPVMVTATYDGTLGDGNAVMWLYVDAATDVSPVYRASSTTAVAPIYNSDADLKIGAWSTNYLNGKVHYAAVYDGTVTTLAEHQAMYAAWKIDGILPLAMSSTTAKTKLVIEFDAKAQWSSTSDIGVAKRFITIGGSTGECSASKNLVNMYVHANGKVIAGFAEDSDATFRYCNSTVAVADHNKWHKHILTLDFSNAANSTYTFDGSAQTLDPSMTGTGHNLSLKDALIRIGQAPDLSISAFAEIRNVKVSAE